MLILVICVEVQLAISFVSDVLAVLHYFFGTHYVTVMFIHFGDFVMHFVDASAVCGCV